MCCKSACVSSLPTAYKYMARMYQVVLSTPLLFASFFILINALRGAATLLIQVNAAPHTLHSSLTKEDSANHASTLFPPFVPEQVKKMEFKEDAKKKSKAAKAGKKGQ